MRRRGLSAVLILSSTITLGQVVPVEPHLCGRGKAAIAAAMLKQPGGGLAAPEMAGAEDTDVLHYHLDIELDPTQRWIGGSNTMTVRSLVGDLTSFSFRLYDAYTITAVTVGGNPATWQRLDYATVAVTLDRPYGVGEEFVLRVDYHTPPGAPVSGGLVFGDHGGHPLIWSHSQPWFAFTWWPGKDYLPDKTTADLWFTVPDTMKVASNGVLLGVDEVALGQLRYRWKTMYPTADYLYCIGATNYDLVETTWEYGGRQMPIQLFVYPEHNVPANMNTWLATPLILSVHSDLYGMYPFVDEKYGMCETGFGGGMEHQTMTSQGGFWEYITIHEASHQWWGDSVTCATWHDIWLNEGFATYAEALFYEHVPGGQGETWLHLWMNVRRPQNVDGTVYCYDISDPNRIFDGNLSYAKAAWVLHMLRHVVGTETYFNILAAYRAEFEGRAALTDDFQRICEAVSGRDLDWFFAEWVYQRGMPRYRVAWQEHLVDGKPYVELYVRQTHTVFWPTYTMPIDIEVTTPGGTNTHLIWSDARSEHHLFPIDQPGVSSLVLDPKPWILRDETTTQSFPDGPPKIVTLAPAPEQTVPAATVPAVEVVFHKDVVVDAGHFALVGQRGGPVALTLAYDPNRYAATLTPQQPLKSDTYTLTVADAIVDVAAGLKLDGELTKPWGLDPLPSGDGTAGGAAQSRFVLTHAGDMNCDGVVSFDDINPFVLAISNWEEWKRTYPGCPGQNADIDGDGQYGGLNGFGDINPFVALLGGP